MVDIIWEERKEKCEKPLFAGYEDNSSKVIYHCPKCKKRWMFIVRTANLVQEIKNSIFNLVSFNKGFREIHDDISGLYDKLRVEKRKDIIPTKTELKRQFEKGEYSIRLAEDTDRLIEIGQKMKICVGSYGSKAVKKKTTIYYMLNRDSNKYVGCFEVKRNKLIQAKGFCNSLLQGAEKSVLEDWVKEKHISAEGCYDFKTA